MKDNKYKKILILEIICFILLFPELMLVIFGSGTCNFRIWTLIIFLIPMMLVAMLDSIVPVTPPIIVYIGFALAPLIIPLILNTIAFKKLKKQSQDEPEEKTESYKKCKKLAIINFAICVLYIIKYLLTDSCVGF